MQAFELAQLKEENIYLIRIESSHTNPKKGAMGSGLISKSAKRPTKNRLTDLTQNQTHLPNLESIATTVTGLEPNEPRCLG